MVSSHQAISHGQKGCGLNSFFTGITLTFSTLPGDTHCDVPDAGLEPALSLSVATVRSAAAELVRLRVHDRVEHLLREPADELPHVDSPIVEPRHAEYVGRRAC